MTAPRDGTGRWALARRWWLPAAALAIGAAAICFRGMPDAKRSRSTALPTCEECNLLLITLDTVRADHLPCYGYPLATMPRLCDLARAGVRFHRAISQSSWTKASMGSLFTSLYPHQHTAVGRQDVLPDEVTTFVERLEQNGFTAAGLQANPFMRKDHGFAQGFRSYRHFSRRAKGEALIDAALRKLERLGERRFFLYLHLMDAHLPYDPPAAYHARFAAGSPGSLEALYFDRRMDVRMGRLKLDQGQREHVRSLYDAELAYLDDQVGRVLDFLESSGLADTTVVLVHSDHGEEFWEHGSFEHGHSMYDEVLRVPLILRVPGAGQGIVVEETVRLIDVYPTLLSVLGIETSEPLEGVDLLPLIRGGASELSELPAFSESTIHGPQQKAVQAGRGKIIVNEESRDYEFYDLATDVGETQPTASAAELRRFRRLLDEFAGKAIPEGVRGAKGQFDPEAIEDLRALGYLE